jgi:hypothetical protein
MVKFILNKKSLMTFGKWSLVLFSLVLIGVFIVQYIIPILAMDPPTKVDDVNVTLISPANNAYTSGVNFTYNISWNTAFGNPTNCTLFGNFTGTFEANATNATAIVNNVVNGINASNVRDGTYNLWNVYCYNATSHGNYSTSNYTVTVDLTNPVINYVYPANSGYFNTNNLNFNVTLTEQNLNTTVNVTVYYGRIGAADYSDTLVCYGTAPNYACNKTKSLTGVINEGETLKFFYNTTDLSGRTTANGTEGSSLTAVLDTTKPGLVSGLYPSGNYTTLYYNSTTLMFNWTAATDVTSGIQKYKIYVWDNLNASGYLYWGDNTSTTGYHFTGADAHNYTINVTAVDNANNENTTGTVSVMMTVDTLAPGYIAGLYPTGNYTTSYYNTSTLMFNWTTHASDATSGLKNYKIYVWYDKNSSGYIYYGTNTSEKGVHFTGANGHNYTVNVTAVDNANNENTTGNVSVTMTVDTSAPDQVTSLRPTGNYTTSYYNITTLMFNWTAPTDISGIKQYNIYVRDNAGSYVYNGTNTSTTGYHFTGADGSNYSVNVTAVDNANNENNGTTSVTMTVDITKPGLVSGLYPSGNYTTLYYNSTTLMFNWTAATDVTSGIQKYKIYVWDNLNASGYLYWGDNTSTTGYHFTGADAHNYTINVTAVDNANNENTTGTVSVMMTVDISNPNAPTSVAFTADPSTSYDDDGTIDVTWTAPTDATSGIQKYKTYVWDNRNASGYLYWGDNISTTGYQFTGLDGHNYTVNVTAVDNANNENTTGGVSSTTITVDTTNPVINNTLPVNGGYIKNPSSVLFQVSLTEQNLDTSVNVTVYYGRIGAADFSDTLVCYGSAPSYTCNKTKNLGALIQNNEVLKFFFNTTDSAGRTNSSGTQGSPLTATADTATPTYANNDDNVTTIRVGDPVLIYAQWTDNQRLAYAWLSTNETGSWVNKTANYSSPAYMVGNTTTWSNFTWQNASVATGTVVGWRIYANDSISNENVTSIVTFTVDNTPPTFTNNNTNVTGTIAKGTIILIYANWTDNVGLGYYWLWNNSGGGAGINDTAIAFGSGTWSNITINTANFPVGSFSASIYANDTSGNQNVTGTITWAIDNTASTWSNNATSVANNTQYVPGRNYGFQINWTDNIAVSVVTLEVGTTNYTNSSGQVSKTGDTYYYNLTDLATGTYTVKWYANDTSNNWNTSDTWSYVIAANQTNPVDIYFVNSSGTYTNQNVTITYNSSIIVNATRVYPNSGTANLYRAGSVISGANETITLAANTNGYAYLANVTGNTNYSANTTGTTYYLFVNNKTLQGSISGAGVTYPTVVGVTPSESNTGDADVNYTFWRNNTLVNSTIGSAPSADTTQLAAGTYHYVLNSTGGANYSENSSIATLDVTVSPGTLSLSITGGTTQFYPYQSTITGIESNDGDTDVTYQLWRETTNVNQTSPYIETITLGVGTYNYRFNATVGTNWTANATGVTTTLTIQINSSTQNFMNLTLGTGTSGTEANYSGMYPLTTNATGWFNSNSFTGPAPTFTLYRGSTNVTSTNPVSDNLELGVGTYVYIYNTSGNTNYTSANKSFTLTININDSNPVNLYFRNSSGEYLNQNMTVTYNTAINATAVMGYSGRGSASLYRGSSDVTNTENGTNIILAATTYTYVANTSGNTNYTSNATGSTYYLTVNRATSTCSLTFNVTSSQFYGTPINASCTCTNTEGTTKLYRNDTEVTNNAGIVLGAGTYNYVCNVSQTTNYTSAENTSSFTISKAPTSITLYLNGTEWTSLQATNYPNVTNVTATINVSALQSSVGLERNGYSPEIVSNPDVARLAYGYWNYTAYFLGNANYSASQNASQLILINKGTPTLTLSASPSWAPTDAQATTVTCSASSQNNEVSAILYRNDTDVNSTQNGIAQLYSSGVYNFTCNSTVTTNYTAASTSQTMTVTGTKGSINGYITDYSTGSGIQGATVYVTGYSGVATTANGYYLISNVNPGTYTITVDKSGYTSNSTSVTVTAGQTAQKNMTMVSAADTTAPLQPTNLAAVQVGSTRQVNITWTASTSSDTIRYNIYYKLNEAVTTSSNSFLVGNVTRTSIAVGSDGNWNFTVTAIDSSNNENTTIITSANITIDTTAPGVSSTSPSGTTTDNTPTLIVNTTEAGYCRFDTLDKTMSSMTYTMTGSGTGHEYTFGSALSDSVYTYYVRCNDTSGNEMVATSISFNLDTRSLFNITKPDTIFSYWTANKWWSFALPLWTIQSTTLTYYNVTSVLASVSGNYNKFYADIGNNDTWRSYVPGRAVNSFTDFTYNGSASIYYIYTNTTDRIEIN